MATAREDIVEVGRTEFLGDDGHAHLRGRTRSAALRPDNAVLAARRNSPQSRLHSGGLAGLLLQP